MLYTVIIQYGEYYSVLEYVENNCCLHSKKLMQKLMTVM